MKKRRAWDERRCMPSGFRLPNRAADFAATSLLWHGSMNLSTK
jgi:hypothetical protein